MKKVKSQLLQLLLTRQQVEGRRISLRQVAKDTGLKEYTVYAFANNTLKEYPGAAIVALCEYFSCGVGELLTIEETTED